MSIFNFKLFSTCTKLVKRINSQRDSKSQIERDKHASPFAAYYVELHTLASLSLIKHPNSRPLFPTFYSDFKKIRLMKL